MFKKMIKKEIEHYIEECNFTKDELEVFLRKCKDESRIEIALDLNMCPEKITNITNDIKDKIKRVAQ